MGKTRKEDPEDGQTTYSGLVQQGYLHPVWIGVGQEEVESFREVGLCHGHQLALSP